MKCLMGADNLNNKLGDNILVNLSDREIFKIQDSFFDYGLHFLKFPNLAVGDRLIDYFLNRLSYYSSPVVISFDSKYLLNNIYYEINYAYGIKSGGIEDYILSDFKYDFLLIEGTNELLNSPVYSEFMNLLINYKIVDTLPVLILSYES